MNRLTGRDRRRWWLSVLLVALTGLVLRTTNIDFDRRQHLMPDERHWSITSASLAAAPAPPPHGTVLGPVLDWLDGQRSPANAYRGADSFVYGPLPLAVSRGVAGWLHRGVVDGDQPAEAVLDLLDAAGVPLLSEQGDPRFDDAYQVDLVGRLLGALADALAILVVAVIGRRLGGPMVGLAAAGVHALSVLAIQHAHFLGAEPFLTLAASLCVLAALHITPTDVRSIAARQGVLAGTAAGAAVALKLSGVGIALVPAAAAGVLLLRRRSATDVVRAAALAVGALVAFRVLHPAAFEGLGLRPSGFWADARHAQDLAFADLPPSLQWARRTPLDPLRWLFQFTVGPGTAIAALVGAVHLVRRRGRFGAPAVAVVLGGWLVPMALVLARPVTTGRYFVPMLPALAVVAGVGLADGLRRATPAGGVRMRPVAVALAALVALWGLAFVNGVYGHDHTRIAASRWIAEHVPEGSTLSHEAWDDALPVGVEGIDPGRWRSEQLNLVGPDSLEKVETLAEQLTRIDYVVESSPRLWGVVNRLPARFPATAAFFDRLDDGTLGFDRMVTFTSPPRLGPFRLDDSGAEEAFSVYDHPEVRIWRRVRDLPERTLLAHLEPVAAQTALAVTPAGATANGNVLFPEERAENARIGTYDDVFGGGPAAAHVAGWAVLVALLAAASLALFAPLLGRLPDAGAGLAPAIGLAGPTAVVFAAVTRLGLPLTRGLVLVVIGGWLAVGAFAGYRRRRLLAELVRARRRHLVGAAALCALAAAAGLALRAANPDLWHPYRGGEKLFELEMFAAVLRTRTLPPYDPWFAGGVLNYHYGGYLMLSIVARTYRTAPELAMQLGLAVVAGLTAGAAYSAGTAAAGWHRRREAPEGGRAVAAAGWLAAFTVLALPSASIVPHLAARLTGREHGVFDWWGLSRIFEESPIPSEFPAWSFVFGDLHGHVLDLPVLITTLVVALALFDAIRDGPWPKIVVLGGGAAVLAGLARAVNSWDFPLAGGAVAAAVALGALGGDRDRVRRGAVAAVAAGAAFFVVWSPYTRRLDATDAGLVLEHLRSPMGSWALYWGGLASATVVVAVGPGGVVRADRPRRWLGGLAAVAAAVALVAVTSDRDVLAVNVALAALCGAAARRSRHGGALVGPLPFLVLGSAWVAVSVIEVVSVVNDNARMNTVFKGWYQAWVLACVGVSAVVAKAAAARTSEAAGRRRAAVHRSTARTLLAAGALLAVGFAQLAVPARMDDRVSDRSPSLDGLAFLGEGSLVGDPPYDPGEDRPLVRWLRANGRGLDVVAERPGNDYQWSGRISALTGLPSIVAWPYHESQQRRSFGAAVEARRADATALYDSLDEATATAVLQRYEVEFVVYGSVEHHDSPAPARDLLLDHPCLHVETRYGPLFVARVDRPCLAGRPGGVPVP